VTPRAATAFKLGEAAEQTFTSGLDTKLFKLSTKAGATVIVDYRIQVPEDGTAIPVGFLFGTSGKADDVIGQVLPAQNPFSGEFNPPPYDLHIALPLVAPSSAVDHYVVLADLSSEKSPKATITAASSNAVAVAEVTTAHGPGAPQSIDAVNADNARIITGEMKTASESDVYKFTVGATDTIQFTALSEPDLEVVLTKDPKVLEDPEDATPAQRKVLGYFYPGGAFSAQRTVTNPGVATVYAVVLSDPQGSKATGKYTFGARKVQ